MRKVKTVFKYIILVLISLLSIFPFAWMIISTTNKSIDVTNGSFKIGTNFLINMKNLFTSDIGFANSLWNSFKIAIITTILALIICSMAGYGFEIFKSKGRTRAFKIILMSMMVPFASLMVPLFRMFSGFKVIRLDTMASVIVPSLATAFLIFFFRQNTKSYPKEILEAGRLDGLSEFQIFFRLFIPTMKSTYAAAAIITFMNSWNNYMWPLIALQTPSKRTVPLIISTLGSSYTPDFGLIMSAVVIATLPTALVFFFMQKEFVAGMTGSIKG